MLAHRTIHELCDRHAGLTVTIFGPDTTAQQAATVTGPRILVGDAIGVVPREPGQTLWIPRGDHGLWLHRVRMGRAGVLAISTDPAIAGNNVLHLPDPVRHPEFDPADPHALALALAQWMGAEQTNEVGFVPAAEPTNEPTSDDTEKHANLQGLSGPELDDQRDGVGDPSGA